MAMLSFKQFANLTDRAVKEMQWGATTSVVRQVVKTVEVGAKAVIGHENNGWAPLSARTVAEKQRLGFTGRISATDPLLRTGEMRDSISSYAVGSVGVVGSPLKKALWMEMGTVKPSGSVPPRSFLGLAMSKVYPVADKAFGLLAVNLVSPNKVK